MGGRGSTFKERVKNINDLLKELGRKKPEEDYDLDLGDKSVDKELQTELNSGKSLKFRNFRVHESINNLDERLINRNLKHINSLSHQYKNITNEILDENTVSIRAHKINKVYLKSGRKVPTLGVVACWSPTDNQICFNERVMKQYKDYIDIQQRSQNSGHHAKVEQTKLDLYTTTHEFGHFVEDCIIKKRVGHKDYDEPTRKETAKEIVLEIANLAQKQSKTVLENKGLTVSDYSHENYYEWFAETFTSTMLNTEHNVLNKAMKEFLEKENKKQ